MLRCLFLKVTEKMGFLYEKSRSEEFGRFFSQSGSFEKKLNWFSLGEGKLIKVHEDSFFSKKNRGGLPLSWNQDEGAVAVDQTDTHALVIGPTGSKKTRLIAMPAVRILGTAGESIIISDPKAEIYARTAKYLQDRDYEISVINLREPDYSRRWNPLSIPYHFYCGGDMDKACEFANDIARNMIPSERERDPFWENSAASLLFGLIILLFQYCYEYHMPERHVNLRNIFELRNILFSERDPKMSILWEFAKKDPFIRNSLIGTVETAKDTRAGILSVFDQAMRNISIQPNLLDMLSGDELNLNRFLEKKQALYLIIPDEKTSYHGLVSLFIKQSYEYFIHLAQKNIQNKGAETGYFPIRINYLLDEFSSLPTVTDFPAMITAARSRNIRFTLFIQSKHQLTQRYRDETETILANCINWIFLTTRELSLLKEISELCGTKDQKPVLSVSHLQRLNKEEGEALILSGRKKPYIAKLPDINLYDGERFQPVSLVKQTPLADIEIDLTPLKEEQLRKEREIKEKIFQVDSQITSIFSNNKSFRNKHLLTAIDKRMEELTEKPE